MLVKGCRIICFMDINIHFSGWFKAQDQEPIIII